MKNYKIYSILLSVFILGGCSDSWLEPKPLSFYTPENTYIDAEGFEAALFACEGVMHDRNDTI